MKKEYMKPTMKVVMLKQRYHMQLSSGEKRGAKSASIDELDWVTDGLGDDDDDV